jgi:hypothetical protein
VPKLVTPDGELDEAAVARQFAASMAEPEPDEPMAAAPPRKAPAEPGQTAQQPADDPKASKARTTSSTPPPAGGERKRRSRRATASSAPPAAAPGRYIKQVDELLESICVAAALIPVPPKKSLLGRFLPITDETRPRLRLQGSVINENRPALASAIDKMAANNSVIRRGVEALTTGGATWILPAAMMLAPFVAQSNMVWTGELTADAIAMADEFEAGVKAELKASFEQAAAAAAEEVRNAGAAA